MHMQVYKEPYCKRHFVAIWSFPLLFRLIGYIGCAVLAYCLAYAPGDMWMRRRVAAAQPHVRFAYRVLARFSVRPALFAFALALLCCAEPQRPCSCQAPCMLSLHVAQAKAIMNRCFSTHTGACAVKSVITSHRFRISNSSPACRMPRATANCGALTLRHKSCWGPDWRSEA